MAQSQSSRLRYIITLYCFLLQDYACKIWCSEKNNHERNVDELVDPPLLLQRTANDNEKFIDANYNNVGQLFKGLENNQFHQSNKNQWSSNQEKNAITLSYWRRALANLENALFSFRNYMKQNQNPNADPEAFNQRQKTFERRTAEREHSKALVDLLNNITQNMPHHATPILESKDQESFKSFADLQNDHFRKHIIQEQHHPGIESDISNNHSFRHGGYKNNEELGDASIAQKSQSPISLPRLASLYTYKRRAANDITWGGCVDPNNPDPEHNRVEIGKRTTICIIISQGENWVNDAKYWRWVFQPTADEYSSFTIADSYTQMVTNHASKEFFDAKYSVSVHAESQKSLSYQRRYYGVKEKFIFPYLTAVIIVENGEVIGITWDESCIFCEEERCIDNTYDFNGSLANIEPKKSCYFEKARCDIARAENKDKTKCDVRIYFAWSGTDKNGKVLTSVDSRFSAFPPNLIEKKGN